MLSDVMLIAVMPFLNGFMVELLTCAALFVWELPRRPRFGVRCGVSVAVVILIGEVTYILQWPNIQSALGNYYWWVWCIILRFFLLYVLCYWAIRQCYVIGRRQGVFYTVAAIAAQHCVYCGTKIITMKLPGDYSDIDTWPGALCFFILTVMFMAAAYWLFAKPLEGQMPERLDNSILLPFLGLLLCVNVFSCLLETAGSTTGMTVTAYLLIMLTRFVTCIFVLALLREIVGRSHAERDGIVLQSLLRQQQSQLAADKATIDLINVKTHDLKKQLTLLDGRISRQEIDDLNGLVVFMILLFIPAMKLWMSYWPINHCFASSKASVLTA